MMMVSAAPLPQAGGMASQGAHPSLALASECVQQLVEQRLLDQADTLASFAIPLASGAGDAGAGLKAGLLLARADALSSRGEHKRALHFYRQAQAVLRLGLPHAPPSRHAPGYPGASCSKGPPGGGGASGAAVTPLAMRVGAQLANQATPKAQLHTAAQGGTPLGGATPLLPPQPSATSACSENQTRLKVAECCMQLKDFRAALQELEAIPQKRSLRVNFLLGQLNTRIGHSRAATAAFKECVRQCPCFLEAVAALVKLGCTVKDVAQLLPTEGGALPEQAAKGVRAPLTGHSLAALHTEVKGTCRWVLKYAEACAARESNRFAAAAELWKELATALGGMQQCPPQLLLDLARAETGQGKYEEAMSHLKRARQLDPHMVEATDDLALLLLLHGAQGERAPASASSLGRWGEEEPLALPDHAGVGPVDAEALARLTADAMALAPHRPEALTVAAAFWCTRGDLERATAHVDQALDLEENNFNALLLKAWLMLQLDPPDAPMAAAVFRRAFMERPELRAVQAFARCCLRAGKWREAAGAAREAVKAFPESSSSFALLGEAYLQGPETRERAKKALDAAMKLKQGSTSAVITLAQWHCKEGHPQAAAELLQQHLESSQHGLAGRAGPGRPLGELVRVQLGYAQLQAKSYIEASMHFQAALLANPKSTLAMLGLQRLDELLKGGATEGMEDLEELPPIEVSPFLL